MDWPMWLSLFGVVALGTTALALLIVFGIIGTLTRASGLPEMVAHYGTDAPLPEPAIHGTHIKIGAVRWRFCSHLAARPEGLHVEIRPPLGRRRRLLIPWSEFGPGQEVLLYWLSAVRFPIGHPPLAQLTVMGNAYEQMQPYLPPASRVVGR